MASSTEPSETQTEHRHVIRLNAVAHVRGTRLPVRVIAELYRAGDLAEDIPPHCPRPNRVCWNGSGRRRRTKCCVC